ncbi:hypothetical protein AVEN_229419-1, partial [Araneus ventricosus]
YGLLSSENGTFRCPEPVLGTTEKVIHRRDVTLVRRETLSVA